MFSLQIDENMCWPGNASVFNDNIGGKKIDMGLAPRIPSHRQKSSKLTNEDLPSVITAKRSGSALIAIGR